MSNLNLDSMDAYYVNNNRQESKDGLHNEVHKNGCYWLSKATNKSYLGEFYTCHGAVAEAKKKYPYSVDGCESCCPDCHRG